MNVSTFFRTAALALATYTTAVLALDTTEPFEVGLTDVETYVGFGGIGLAKGEKGFSSEHVLGAGITDKLSTTLVVGFESDEYFGNGSAAIGLGLYYNVTESDKFGFDLMSSLTFNEGFALGGEFNFYFEKVGFQLSLEESLFNNGAEKIGFATAFAPLVHFNLSDEAQILTAVDFAIDHSADESSMEIGALGLGFNKVLSDAVELITEVSYDIPQDDEKGSLGISIGFVATVFQ